MDRRWIVLTLLLLLATGGAIVADRDPAGEWAIEASWTDACCCKVSCPCLFGTKPTEGYCQGASLIEIDRGHHGGVKLDGVAALVTYHVGGWSKIFVSDTASREIVAAMGALMPEVLPFLKKGSQPTVEVAPLVVERDGDSIAYSVPQTRVALTMVRGANGEPITIQNLPAKGKPFPESDEHTQYKSRQLKHESEDHQFDWSERNGFSAKLNLSGPVAEAR